MASRARNHRTDQHPPDPEFESLLEFLHRARGFDFSSYKRPGLVRRMQKRMQTVGVATYPEYQDYLEVHPDEFGLLFNTVLINVTTFFRDPATWEYVQSTVVPHVLANRGTEPVRVWSAGTASGEEAYTLAMIFGESIGLNATRERVKIYATDLDEEALAKARLATYSEREINGVPPELVHKYFEQVRDSYVFRGDLRRQVIFGRHDLLQDAPISRVDLLTCRNSLMYFNAEAQARIVARFHFALAPGGVLVLGRAETLVSHSEFFVPLDAKRRIFAKVAVPVGAERPSFAVHTSADGGLQLADADLRLRQIAADASPVAQVVLDARGTVVMVNETARTQFGITAAEVGRPFQDLQLSYRPLELRARLEQAVAERRPVVATGVEWPQREGDPRWLDVVVTPIFTPAGDSIGASITFPDVTVARGLQQEVEQAHSELETAYEELQSTNEELETTNEELQSTVEELETTNEELQSTNEELETMNEELQSTNEELSSINDELRHRSEELNDANAFLESVLASLDAGVVVLDRELRVLSWNRRAEDQWGVRADEAVGRPFVSLDIGLPVRELEAPLVRALSGADIVVEEVDATNRRGARVRCRVRCIPLHTANGARRGVIVTIQ